MVTKLLPFAESRPLEPALVDETGTTTWGAANTRSNQLIAGLRTAGLQPEDAVAILAGNCREYFELLSACAHASLVAVPLNWHFTAEEVAYVLADSDARALVAGSGFGELAAEASHCVEPEIRVAIGDNAPHGFARYEEMLDSAPDTEPDEQGAGGVMFYTSGTTGRPKGVRRKGGLGAPVEAMAPGAQGFAAMLGIPQGGVSLVCGPVYHSAQWAFSSFPFELGSTLILRHRFDAAESLELIDRHGVTNVHLVPTQFVRLLGLEDSVRESFDGSSLVQVLHGAAPCPHEVKRRMIEWWGPVVTEYYGGTEGAVVSVISSAEWLERPTSVGRPLPIIEVTILDEQGQACALGEAGQIYLQSLVAGGFEYHKDAEKTASVHRKPGVFTMGDIGLIDAAGYLHLTDRKIDMIISGGVNIYPAEIERVLGGHPLVADVAVIGVPNEEYGEEVKAIVVPAEEAMSSDDLAQQLIAFCREHLAGYKAPRSVDFESELPRQETGKLYKRMLRERYWKAHERPI